MHFLSRAGKQGLEAEALPFLKKAHNIFVSALGPDSEDAEVLKDLLESLKKTKASKARTSVFFCVCCSELVSNGEILRFSLGLGC